MICVKCGAEKPLADYYANDRSCKVCRCAMVRENRRTNPKVQERDRKRGSRQSKDYLKGYRAKYPKKYTAQTAVNNALRDGRLTKIENCVECDSDFAVEAHHDDYDFPLTVRWLCAVCHKRWHAEHGEALNGGNKNDLDFRSDYRHSLRPPTMVLDHGFLHGLANNPN